MWGCCRGFFRVLAAHDLQREIKTEPRSQHSWVLDVPCLAATQQSQGGYLPLQGFLGYDCCGYYSIHPQVRGNISLTCLQTQKHVCVFIFGFAVLGWKSLGLRFFSALLTLLNFGKIIVRLKFFKYSSKMTNDSPNDKNVLEFNECVIDSNLTIIVILCTIHMAIGYGRIFKDAWKRS